MERIYFDHAASSPLHPDVADAMMAVYKETFGNASSTHSFGRAAKALLGRSRERIAAAVGCAPNELYFTSGGTESDNAAIAGVARAMHKQGKAHIITSSVEHHAVLRTCEALRKEGFELTVLSVDEFGQVSPADVEAAIRPDTALVTVMYANNETGTIQPIEAIGAIARDRGIPFHVDAVQALGSIPIDLKTLPVDLMSFSAHKINGPQGIGALYIAKHLPFEPLLFGGSQERKRRAGTENLAGAAGFAAAAELAVKSMTEKKLFLDKLRLNWIERMKDAYGAERIAMNGHPTQTLPHIANLSFIGLDTETLLMNFDLAGIAVSGGSACTAGAIEPSHVLIAMGLSEARLRSAIRFSFGLGNTLEELERANQKIATFLNHARTNA